MYRGYCNVLGLRPTPHREVTLQQPWPEYARGHSAQPERGV